MRGLAFGALFALMAFAPAMGLVRSGNTVTLTEEEMAGCQAQGGCTFWSQQAIDELTATAKAVGRATCMRSLT